MNIETLNVPEIIAGWILCTAALWCMWRFGLREMAFFRLVLEVFARSPWVRWPLGLAVSVAVYLMVFSAFFAVASGKPQNIIHPVSARRE